MSLASTSLPFRSFQRRRVVVTGHTGFKGGWLALWLARLGADVLGVALPPPPGGSFFESVDLGGLARHRIADVRSPESFAAAVAGFDAELIVHMAAQPLVLTSYEHPVETYATNVLGTAVVLEAARRMRSLEAILVVTSDKCYENTGRKDGYREDDDLGGADPYSSSKACAELVVGAYRRSFFSDATSPRLATVRAGNVFGGGDFAEHRLVPDLVRAAVTGRSAAIRNPGSIRPWQHVLDALNGYLILAAGLLDGRKDLADAWNFGPGREAMIDAGEMASRFANAWGGGGVSLDLSDCPTGFPEAAILRLDSTRARTLLGWRSRLDLDAAIRMTVEWYKALDGGSCAMRALSCAQIDSFMATPAG